MEGWGIGWTGYWELVQCPQRITVREVMICLHILCGLAVNATHVCAVDWLFDACLLLVDVSCIFLKLAFLFIYSSSCGMCLLLYAPCTCFSIQVK
jgi:hypothetical protein